MQGLQLNLINVRFFLIQASTESVNRTLMKGTQARTYVSVLFEHNCSLLSCIWSRIKRSDSLPGQKQNSRWLGQEPGLWLFVGKCH